MKILEIDHRIGGFDDGLKPLWLQQLKRIVILAGPNGAGKSRILRRLSAMAGHWHQGTVDDLANRLRLQQVPPAEIDKPVLARIGVKAELAEIYHAAGDWMEQRFSIIDFVPATLALIDPDDKTLNSLVKAEKNARTPGIQNIVATNLLYLRRIMDMAWDAEHPRYNALEVERKKKTADYQRLSEQIERVVRIKIDRHTDNATMTFDGRTFGEAKLSEGQRCLLLWVLALDAQGSSLGDLTLSFDEPENHLHPDALVETLKRIAVLNEKGQMWIATHSPSLVAAMLHDFPNDVSLYCVENGLASYAGREPERVLRSLVGGEQNIQALREFIDLPEIMAINRFGAECLLPAEVVTGGAQNDPQIKIAERAIFDRADGPDPVRVLDFGSGGGRLLESLSIGREAEISSRLDYVAFDRADAVQRTKCESIISRFYGASSNRWFAERNALAAVFEDHSFDAVVMCNVLHEIDPLAWISTFDKESVIANALKPAGWLLIVEDYLMPKGEHAHPYGFIVLDTEALVRLFRPADRAQLQVIEANGSHSKRIRAHQVAASLLSNVTADSRRESLGFAHRNAKENLQRLRESSERTFRSGQAYAFWTQQFANTKLAIDSLG